MSTRVMRALKTRLIPWIELARLPAFLSAWSNILAAHLIATGGSPAWRLLLLQLGIATCLYWAGMILNERFDQAMDRREWPRPPANRVAPGAAWAAGFGLLTGGILLGALAGRGPLLIASLLATVMLGYDLYLKRGPLGPPAMALCRWLTWLLGLSVAAVRLPELLLALPVFLYTMSMTLLSRGENEDCNRRAVRRATVALVFALAAALALYPLGILHDPYALALTAVTGALLVRRLLRLADDPTVPRVRASVDFMLLCMIPLDALLLGGAGQRLAALALLLLLVPGWFLAWWVQVTT